MTRYGEVPSVLEPVGDVRGRSVLDLACGTGFHSGELERRGASDVVGVDISAEMVAAAREIDRREPLGVRYEVGGVAGLPLLGTPFDLALEWVPLRVSDGGVRAFGEGFRADPPLEMPRCRA
ncbi:class I SAM-dependent methyltransferase [Streptomyces sp. NPDC093249]|uniref:class I SAM-dependent methyltransferase n=1 Tax=unclassified Streptomyces TaxID=2593676 RepID=UPI003450D99B